MCYTKNNKVTERSTKMPLFNRNFSKPNPAVQNQQKHTASQRAPEPNNSRQGQQNVHKQRPLPVQNHRNREPNRRTPPPAQANGPTVQNRHAQGENAIKRVPMRTPPPRKSSPASTTSQGRGTVYPQGSPPTQQNRPLPNKSSVPTQTSATAKKTTHAPISKAPQTAPTNPSKNKAVHAPKKSRAPIITAEGLRAFCFILLVSLLLYVIICTVTFGAFYAYNNVHFNWNHDVTVKLDKGVPKTENYITSEDVVFRDPSGEPYVNLTKIADSLSLSSIGGGNQIKFYKTNDLQSYIVFTNGSKDVIINGEQIRLSSPAYVSNKAVYVPISLFQYYTNGITVSYDKSERVMTITYEIDNELSTPKRKVLKEFAFIVHAPQSIPEMTEKEWFEYVENVKN